MNHFREVLKKYKVFSGRATRAEYWYFILFQNLIFIALSVIDLFTGTLGILLGFGLLSGLYMFATLVPTIAVAVRRLHDIGRSGVSLLFGLIPFAGPIIMLVFFVTDSQPGTNQYGPNPKEAAVVPTQS